jgi:succinoglycan biosynthesis transport protein ExoP
MEEDKIIPRRIPANDPIEIVPPGQLHPWEQLEREPHIRDYWRIVRKHQWLILTFLLTVVTAVTIATFKMKPVYEASARIEVDQETSNILPFQNTDPYGAYEDLDTYIETQAKVLLSETLALETIKSLGLASNPEFGGTPGGSVSVPSIDSSQAPISRPAILGNFIGSLSVKRVPNSRLLEIAFSSTDPNLAARVLNAHLQTFIDYNFRSRYEATTQGSPTNAPITFGKSTKNRTSQARSSVT